MMGLLDPKVVIPKDSKYGAMADRCSVLAWVSWSVRRGLPVSLASAGEWGLMDGLAFAAKRKRWDRLVSSVRAVGVGLEWNGSTLAFDVDYSRPVAQPEPDMDFGTLELIRAVLVTERLHRGPAGLGELAALIGQDIHYTATLLRRLMMVGCPPYRPHDYFGFERTAGIVEMFSGPRLWGEA